LKTSIYIHWPFCKSKCPYCDFNSHVSNLIDYDKWEKAYAREIDHFKEYLTGKEIVSIFFGGGTPSLMPASLVAFIINKLAGDYNLSDNIEITLEANPTSIEAEKFKNFASVGINRVSIGVQSFNEDDLKFLGRNHSKNEAIDAIEIAQHHFSDYSFDLIYARPNQTLDSWEKELRYALGFVSGHMSLYQLTIEKGTPFYKSYANLEFKLPDQELAADLYNLTNEIMNQHQMPAYEISNHAKIGKESKHNLGYWRYGEYLGIGPGAHSRINNQAMMMIHSPANWLEQVFAGGHGIQNLTKLTSQEILEEMLMMGLRLAEGINIKYLEEKLEKKFSELISVEKLNYLIENNLIIMDDFLKTTDHGKLILNQVIRKLIL
jgi:oxygen-independent coproporphyrinogen-3 oxidase